MIKQKSQLQPSDALPDLAALYQRRLLVPFVGSGMSRGVCTGWAEFLGKLATLAGTTGKATTDSMASAELYRLADITVTSLRRLRREARNTFYREALLIDNEVPIPPATAALGKIYWPLVLTTNYDDLYWTAANRTRPAVLGRDRQDCHAVLRSLDASQPAILWALQGFLGGQKTAPDLIVKDPRRQDLLSDQLVVGHHQYQRAVNEDGHFRRAFAEVYRRRSLLFLGSGILEDYLVNLFSETMHQLGPSSQPHFAVLDIKEKPKFDPWFMQTRLGIVPLFYEGRNEIEDLLVRLHDMVTHVPQTGTGEKTKAPCRLEQLTFQVSLRADVKVRVSFSNDTLAYPIPPNECVIVSVGRQSNKPKYGMQADCLCRKAGISEQQWIALDGAAAYAFRAGSTQCFAVAARQKEISPQGNDRRDLGVIPEAIMTVFSEVRKAGFNAIHMGTIASGPTRPWHPIHPFVQMLRGIRAFLMQPESSGLEEIKIHIVDPSIWGPIESGLLRVEALLSAELVTVRVDIADAEGHVETVTVTLPDCPTLDELLAECQVKKEDWQVEVSPAPMAQRELVSDGQMVIPPTMTVLLRPLPR